VTLPVGLMTVPKVNGVTPRPAGVRGVYLVGDGTTSRGRLAASPLLELLRPAPRGSRFKDRIGMRTRVRRTG